MPVHTIRDGGDLKGVWRRALLFPPGGYSAAQQEVGEEEREAGVSVAAFMRDAVGKD